MRKKAKKENNKDKKKKEKAKRCQDKKNHLLKGVSNMRSFMSPDEHAWIEKKAKEYQDAHGELPKKLWYEAMLQKGKKKHVLNSFATAEGLRSHVRKVLARAAAQSENID